LLEVLIWRDWRRPRGLEAALYSPRGSTMALGWNRPSRRVEVHHRRRQRQLAKKEPWWRGGRPTGLGLGPPCGVLWCLLECPCMAVTWR
jgi:hypothetical protein